jgi:SAM-dependent methyltransferase
MDASAMLPEAKLLQSEHDDVRYLFAKEPVDDRALNRVVLGQFQSALAGLKASPLQVLEIGAGVGTMLSRLVDWGVLPNATYTLVDRDLASLEAARSQLVKWADSAASAGGSTLLRRGSVQIELVCVHADALRYAAQPDNAARFDVILANAVLDLMDVEPAVKLLWAALKPGAPYWFTINFDGETIFLPEEPADDRVMALYHRTMDERVIDGKPSGDSRSGRHLLEILPRTGARVRSAGSSDWVVLPSGGKYPADEQYFVLHILRTVYTAVLPLTAQAGAGPGAAGAPLSTEELCSWFEARLRQLAEGKLIYLAHQLDVFGNSPEPAP